MVATTTASSSNERAAIEASLNRNPHPDFKDVESQRPAWDSDAEWGFTKTKNPSWKFGDGANDGGACLTKESAEVDPHEEGRPVSFNYKLLISGFVPRPIAFLSTISKDGSSTNLAPFSYSQLVNDDPPTFVIGFASPLDRAKDSLKNLTETGECVINMISEHFVEAANACSINAPYGVSEWALSGLTQAPCTTVNPSRVKEAVFAIEGKLINIIEFDSRAVPGTKSGTMAVIEGTRFWVREDALNKEKNLIDPEILKPVSRLGGITYGRTTAGYEMLRPLWDENLKGQSS